MGCCCPKQVKKPVKSKEIMDLISNQQITNEINQVWKLTIKSINNKFNIGN